MSDIMQYINPELVILIPVLYLIGFALKKSDSVKDNQIPLILGLIGIALAMIWVLSTGSFVIWQNWLTAMFTAIVQGVLCTGSAVYVNQLAKRIDKDE